MLLLSLFVACCFTPPCFAAALPEGFSFCDLSSCNISSMKAHRSTSSPRLDGNISYGEYGEGAKAEFSTGLFVISDGRALEQESLFGEFASQESFAALDREFIYLASLITVDSRSVGPFIKKEVGSVYAVSFSLGLVPGEHPAERCSFWTNEYYFSSETLACVGVSGERVARSVKEESSVTLRISSLSDMYRGNGYTAPNGAIWTAEEYSRYAALSVKKLEGRTEITVEIKLPVGDALLSVPASFRERIGDQIQSGSGTLCGSFATKSKFFSSHSLGIGIAASESCPFDTAGADWRTVIMENFEAPQSGLYLPEIIPVPLYLAGDIPEPKRSDLESGGTDSLLQEEQAAEAVLHPSGATVSDAKEETEKREVGIPASSSLVTNEEDESFFASLPHADDMLPEETEIIYLENETAEETNEEGEQGSLVGSILTFGAGVLLFAAVSLFCFVFRREESKNVDPKNRDQKGKKSPKNSKNT